MVIDSPMFERLSAVVPAYRTIFETIEGQILRGEIEIGQELPPETELAQAFGVTRNTLREGVRLLEQVGYVTRENSRRLTVCMPHYLDHMPSASKALAMHAVTFRELWEVAMLLEPGAAALAAERITDGMVDDLQQNVLDTQAAIADGRDIVDLDVEFHDVIAAAAGNKAMELARNPVSLLFYPTLGRLFQHPGAEAAPSRLADAHQRVVDALRERDVPATEREMRRHMADFRRGYEHYDLDLDDPVIPPARTSGTAGSRATN